MLTKVRYSPLDIIMWTRWETLFFIVFAAAITALYHLLGLNFLHLPWAPVAVIGTAVAFIVGFQNNAAYGRIWEARKIWGGIVNVSRSMGIKTLDMVSGSHHNGPVDAAEIKEHHRVILYRHIAWMAALRHAMRGHKEWEEFHNDRTNREWAEAMQIPEWLTTLSDDLAPLLSEAELKIVLGKTNKSTALLRLQSNHLRELHEAGLLWEFAFLELENVLQELFALQGKSERIKNFPYPRQYATLSFSFVRIFAFFLPFAAIPEFALIGARLAESQPVIGPHFIWLAVPFCAIISWVFHTMERIGRAGENPFEGTANDVPISNIARGIEIDLREMLEEDASKMPAPYANARSIQL